MFNKYEEGKNKLNNNLNIHKGKKYLVNTIEKEI